MTTVPSNRDPSPLLGDSLSQGNATPALLGGASSSDMDQSPLERLIAQSTSEQAAAAPFFIEDPTTTSSLQRDLMEPVSSSFLLHTTFVTLGAGTLCLLQICLVWASFLSSAWFETHLKITVGGSSLLSSTNNLEFSTDQTLQKTTLASLLSMLLGADQDWPAMILVLTCLICPCLCMLLCPLWTYGDYQAAIVGHTQSRTMAADLLGFNPRVLVEHFMVRICFLAFFMLAILDVGTSSVSLENNHSEFLVTNRTRGGIVCYTLGMACALCVVVLLRVVSQEAYQPPANESSSANPSTPRYTRQEHPRAPPDRAFQELQRPLLLLDAEEGEQPVERSGVAPRVSHASPSFVVADPDMASWKRFVIYELMILTVVLWIPALFLPLFRITFDGLVASFMEEVSFEVGFFQVPGVLAQRGFAAGTDQWMLLSLGIVLLSLVYVFPMIAAAAAVSAWRSPNHSKAVWFYKAVLRCLQPCLCGVIFSASLFLAVPAFEPLGDYLLDTQTSGFCQRFQDITDTSCLVILGQHSLGNWFLLAQSLSLEILAVLTIMWKT